MLYSTQKKTLYNHACILRRSIYQHPKLNELVKNWMIELNSILNSMCVSTVINITWPQHHEHEG